MLAEPAHVFMPMQGCQSTAYKDEQIVQGKVVEAIVEAVFCYEAPSACVETGVGSPPVKGELKAEEQDQAEKHVIFIDKAE